MSETKDIQIGSLVRITKEDFEYKRGIVMGESKDGSTFKVKFEPDKTLKVGKNFVEKITLEN